MNESTSFEDRLLAVLEAEVAQGATKQSAAGKRSRIRPARIGVLVGAAAVAAVAAVGAPVVSGPDAASAAWAVQTRTDGSVEVTISKMRDAAGLERRLAEAGIPAYVTFLPAGMNCRHREYVGSDFNPRSNPFEGSVRGFIVHPGRLGPNERLEMIGRMDSESSMMRAGVVPLNAERCTIVPDGLPHHESADPAATPGR